MKRIWGIVASAAALALIAISYSQAQPASAPDYAAIVNAPDRSDADKQNDKRRDPTELLAFTGAKPGMKVIDMAAGAGYSTELMARAVAPNGTVYAQNPEGLPQKPKDAMAARMQTPGMKNVVADIQPFDNPVPAGVNNIDLITFFFGYHDTTYLPVDRAKMNKAMFDALKSGGVLVVADYAAAPGAPITTGKQYHRLDEAIEKQEIEAAGFKLVGEGKFLRSDKDSHDFPVFNPQVPIDIYVLKFQKP
jgi:predicted methyltransferase